MTDPSARRLVEARLGRAPQDALEAAVVLEAWAGMPAQRALETARAIMPRAFAPPAVGATRPVAPTRPPGMLLEGAALLVTVCAIALWAQPLTAELGAGVVGRALTLALPLTLGLQWALRARHLGRPSGLEGLRDRRGALALAAMVIVAAGAAALGPAGVLAGLLVVTWTSGSVLLRRGWVAGYAAIIAGATPALLSGAPAREVVAAVAALTAAEAWFALRPAPARRADDDPHTPPLPKEGQSLFKFARASRRRSAVVPATAVSKEGQSLFKFRGRRRSAVVPGRWSRTIGAGLTGVGIGVLLVGDPAVSWAGGAVAALALLPSAAGGLWAGHALWRLADAFPKALSGVAACDGPRPSVRGPVGALAEAICRLVAVTAAGSAVLLLAAPHTIGVGVLAGFGAIALAGLLVALLESLGRPVWATAGVAAGVAAELLAPTPFAGAGLLAGGTVAVLVMVPAALVLLARPARTLATALWIT